MKKNGQGMPFCARLCLYSNTPEPPLMMFNWGFPALPCCSVCRETTFWNNLGYSRNRSFEDYLLRQADSWNYWKAHKQERCPPHGNITHVTWQADIKPVSGSVVQALLSGISTDTEEKLKWSHTKHPHASPTTGSHFPHPTGVEWSKALQVCGRVGISPGLTGTVRWGEMPHMTLYRAMLHCKHSLFLTRTFKAMLLACIAEMHAHGN